MYLKFRWSTIALIWILFASLGNSAADAQPTLSPFEFLPGDTAVGSSVETQEWPQISAGDDGYLVVWQDMRPVLSGSTNTPDLALGGNGWDIYAALLDGTGQVVKSPILISQRGKNDTRPQVGWNGSEWLVVWISERPDWYFFEDVVGARVSADGELIDTEAIVIRPEHNDPANDLAEKPRVASDGTDWVIVWEAITWEGFSGDLNLTGRRMLADGTFPDPERILYQYDGIVFGPENPQIAWAGDQYLLVWDDFGDLKAQRFDFQLRPIDPDPIDISTIGTKPRLATNGVDFMIVTESYRAYRVTADGVSLDPNGGINFDIGGNVFQPDGPNVAWDGDDWVITFGSGEGFTDSDIYFLKIDSEGEIVPPGAVVAQSNTKNEFQPAIASLGDGTSQLSWVEAFPEDVRGLNIDATGARGPDLDLSVGEHRQANLRFATQGDEHLAVYTAEGDGELLVLAQRVNKTGGVIDTEPTVVSEHDEADLVRVDVAFDGTYYLVIWRDAGGLIWGQRLDAAGELVDTFPRIIATVDFAGDVAVGAIDGNFLVTYTYTFSGDNQHLKALRVRGSDLVVLDTPFTIGFNFAKEPRVAGLGGRWIVVWENQTSHDQSSSATQGIFVSPEGSAGTSFAIDQSGFGDDPDIAVLGDQAFIVWYDNANFGDSFIEGRIMAADGSFDTAEFLIADAPNDQFFTRAGTDGERFIAAWTDYRSNEGIESLRGDIWAARVETTGDVVDLGGFQVSAGVLPEDLPDVAGADGRTVVGFSALGGVSQPEVQRMAYRVLDQQMSLSVEGECPGVITVDLDGATLFGDVTFARALAPGSSVLPGGGCAGATLDLEAPTRLGTVTADSEGRVQFSREVSAGLCGALIQAIDTSTCGISSFVALPESSE